MGYSTKEQRKKGERTMAKDYDTLSKRMKEYEATSKNCLVLGTPKVIRLDMRAGHTFCKKLNRPFDDTFAECMVMATLELCKEIPGVVMGYTQSDEISLVLNDITKNGKFKCFFDGKVQKMVSLSASICTIAFNRAWMKKSKELGGVYKDNNWKAQFDSRVWSLPNTNEVHNYLLWRQNDATRNSIQMVGHAIFTDAEMHKKKNNDIQDMLMIQKGINWNDFPARHKRGIAILKEQYMKDMVLPNGMLATEVKRKRWIPFDMPILTKDTLFVDKVYNKYMLSDGVLKETDK